MSEYKRLTYKNNRGEWCIDKTKDNAIVPVQDGENRYYVGEPIDRLAELETEIENGTLVRLPCKVGDKVYCVVDTDEKEEPFYIKESRCRMLNYENGHFEIVPDIDDIWLDLEGVFATKAQAEAKLRELKGEQ